MAVVPVFRPSFGEEELQQVKEALESGWVGLGPKVAEFERRFAEYIGVPYAVGLSSGTAALDLAMRLAAVQDREVITTPLTFVSTNHAILYSAGVPVFCDIERDTLNIDATKIERLVTGRTRAIMVVHYGGHACDMDPILDIARRHNLLVVEDCAHATGGEYRGRRLGSLGDYACFSFHAVKNLAMGEGGLVTARDAADDAALRRLRWVGISKSTWERSEGGGKRYSWQYDVTELGFKCHLNDIAAGIGLAQLAKLARNNGRRRAIVAEYNAAFRDLEWLETPVVKDYAVPSYHNYVIKTPFRDDLHEHLARHEISTSVHYVPSTHYALYKSYRAEVPVCEAAWQELLTLPLFPDLSSADVGRIIDRVRAFRPGRTRA
ncbi:MAG: DegT/DnrJ/EryC1/StrS family aminotransferase [Candidatus Rokubacteria bacterium]|nr:DegT/DnrJ/EryC1/StrS family aminotransferase [Candidatus Rokubacteria bacterium]